MSTILLVRHPPVARVWQGRCYGQSDMGWSREGGAMARDLARHLAAAEPALVVHSGLRRTERLAAMVGAPMSVDHRWRERYFGSWEGRRWGAIWRETGALMDRMVTDPDSFRPGGGETTADMTARAVGAWLDLPRRGTVVIVTHGGPIAAIRQHLLEGAGEIAALIPACGEVVHLTR